MASHHVNAPTCIPDLTDSHRVTSQLTTVALHLSASPHRWPGSLLYHMELKGHVDAVSSFLASSCHGYSSPLLEKPCASVGSPDTIDITLLRVLHGEWDTNALYSQLSL